MKNILYTLLRAVVVMLIVILTAGVFCVTQASDLRHKADSIIALLPELRDTERLDAITYICDVAYALGEPRFEQLWLEELRLAADKNKDYKLSGYAALSLLISFYNYDMFDKLETRYDEIQAYQLEHGNVGFYYSGWSVKVFRILAEKEYYKALAELNKMQQDAVKRKSVFGEGIAGCALGLLYCEGWRDTERALDSYRNALARLASQEHVSGTELVTYYDCCLLLLNEKRYKEARALAQTWLERIAKSVQKGENATDTYSTNEYYALYYAFMTLLEAKEDNKEKVHESFAQFAKYQTMRSCITDQLLYNTYEIYYSYIGLWDSAIVYNSKRLDYMRMEALPHAILPVLAERARLLRKKGEYFAAAHNFREYIDMRDSLDVEQNRLLLKEFGEAHQINQLDVSQRQFRNYMIASSVILALMLAIALQFFIYARRLRRKNSVLYTAIQKSLSRSMTATEESTNNTAIVLSNPTVLEIQSQRFYRALEYLMQVRQLFKLSDLTSRDLVRMLGTNRANLNEIIRTQTNGKTLNAYINQYRLQYAVELLLRTPELAITNIALQAGFHSRSSFTRQFQKEFRITPTEYRAEHFKGNK